MAPFLSVSLAICFSVGPILSSTLTYLDIRNLSRAEGQVSEYDYRWERIIGIIVGTSSVGLGITGLIATAAEPHPAEMYSWLDAIIMCNLQLLTSSNLVRMLQIFISPPWSIWTVYLVAVLTILEIASAVKDKTKSSAYESALLTRFATASLFSSALSHKQLEIHKNSGSDSGDRDEEYMRLLHAFVFTNAAAASSQFCSAIFTSSFSLAGRSTSTKLRQSIFILLCYLPFYINRIWRRIIVPISDWMRRLGHSFPCRLADESNF
ncbi:hypothetical protein COCCADRAFT_113676 [Bipolaris zeicola 26-R-13]|uniref:Uncharacterized protein n=1 Tax=Cochliobolus carbonum (strain 26-R-13) TaxID=930089 RepID=W6XHZ9_COCC2|nr:uncharacterized protein COCCADRAFT_113676 [Bipolaris zeicola 26-R-13]EUC26667.1 hypothetical protein COCCADRAFT_113676 [Bipolaris zeicola 26-R-13]